jgi:hypothetical protein
LPDVFFYCRTFFPIAGRFFSIAARFSSLPVIFFIAGLFISSPKFFLDRGGIFFL